MENTPEIQGSPEKTESAKKQRMIAVLAMEAGLEFAGYIAIPLIGLVLLGRWLDRKYNHHFFVLIGMFLALALSSYIIYKRINAMKKLLK